MTIQWLISVDDHVIEPPNLWVDRVAAKDRERVPHVVSSDGADKWYYDDVLRGVEIGGSVAHAGKQIEEFSVGGVPYADMRPGYYDSAARLADMDADGVWASLCFPHIPRFCGQAFYRASDREMALRCLQIWNDWMIEEWCAADPHRFIPLALIPLWDPRLAAAEIERMAGRGAKAISFSELPYELGLPSIHDPNGHWDPVFRAANDTQMPLCLHFGSSSTIPQTSHDAPHLTRCAIVTQSLMKSLADWLFCGHFDRFPNLKITLAEGGIGWIPYALERADHSLESYRHMLDMDFSVDLLTGETVPVPARHVISRLPSDVFREHVFGCFIDDEFGARHVDEIGADNVMIEVDYPHKDTTFPRSIDTARASLAGQPADVQYKVTMGNALRVFCFDPGDVPVAPASGARSA